MELNNKIIIDLDTTSYVNQYKDLCDMLLKRVEEQNEIIKDQKFRLDNIQYILNAEVRITKYGKISTHETSEIVDTDEEFKVTNEQ